MSCSGVCSQQDIHLCISKSATCIGKFFSFDVTLTMMEPMNFIFKPVLFNLEQNSSGWTSTFSPDFMPKTCRQKRCIILIREGTRRVTGQSDVRANVHACTVHVIVRRLRPAETVLHGIHIWPVSSHTGNSVTRYRKFDVVISHCGIVNQPEQRHHQFLRL